MTVMTMIRLANRGVLRLSGPDRFTFLQGLVSNDVRGVAEGRAVYACLLTPQGKFLHDMFLAAQGETVLIECEADRKDDLARRLKMFRLRAKIEIEDTGDEFSTFAAHDPTNIPDGVIAFADPRLEALGHRILIPGDGASVEAPTPFSDWDRLRIGLAVPDGSRDMEVGKAILLENNIDVLSGISWDKGCYMGQELTARTRYRGLVKKRLAPVAIAGEAPPVGAPLIEDGREVGEMRTSSGDLGLALLRLERLRQGAPVAVDGAILTPRLPAHLASLLEAAEA
jgi:folate-binding protein YgfZ